MKCSAAGFDVDCKWAASRCISDNNGASFWAVERYTGNFPSQCIKGELISAEGLDYNAMETYGDISKDYNPFLLINASDPIPKLQALPFEKKYSLFL